MWHIEFIDADVGDVRQFVASAEKLIKPRRVGVNYGTDACLMILKVWEKRTDNLAPDIFVIDPNMPGNNSHAILDYLRNSALFYDVPIVTYSLEKPRNAAWRGFRNLKKGGQKEADVAAMAILEILKYPKVDRDRKE